MPWKKNTRRGKYTRHPPSSPSDNLHPQLLEIQSRISVAEDSSEQRELITNAVRLLYPFEPREKQVDCIQWLLFQEEDLVLVAKTSFGKSLVWQILPCLVPGTIIIAILPLLALGAEQASSIEKYLAANAAARPMFVNSNNISKSVLHDIRRGYYTHILVSPELLTGKKFRPLLQDPNFRSMIRWVVIDELHLVSVWGEDFRKSYAMLETIRHTLGHKSWFGCTATLDNKIWQKVWISTGMKESTHTIQTPIDRPEVALIRNVIKKADKNSFKPLQFVVADASRRRDGTRLSSSPGFHELATSDFTDLELNIQSSQISRTDQPLIPASEPSLQWTDVWTPGNYSEINRSLPSTRLKRGGRLSQKDNLRLPSAEELVPCPESIPKTVIFTDTRIRCCDMTCAIRQWLQRLGYTPELATSTVQPYYSTMIDEDKDRILNRFAAASSRTRILISSEALAHGKDIPDVDIVVIYGLSRDNEPSIFWQKFGRAARAVGRKGMAVLLADSWCIGGRNRPGNRQPSGQNNRLSQQVFPEDIPSGIESGAFDTPLTPTARDMDTYIPSSPPILSNAMASSPPLRHVESFLPKSPTKQRKTDAVRRVELPSVVWEFMNSSGCIRQLWLEWFSDNQSLSPSKGWCCSNCNPQLNITNFDIKLEDSNPETPAEGFGDHNALFEKELRKWLRDWIRENITDYPFSPPPEFIVSKTRIFEISCDDFPTEPRLIREYLQGGPESGRLGSDIEKLVHFIGNAKQNLTSNIPIMSQRDMPITTPRRTALSKAPKRKALADISSNVTTSRKRGRK